MVFSILVVLSSYLYTFCLANLEKRNQDTFDACRDTYGNEWDPIWALCQTDETWLAMCRNTQTGEEREVNGSCDPGSQCENVTRKRTITSRGGVIWTVEDIKCIQSNQRKNVHEAQASKRQKTEMAIKPANQIGVTEVEAVCSTVGVSLPHHVLETGGQLSVSVNGILEQMSTKASWVSWIGKINAQSEIECALSGSSVDALLRGAVFNYPVLDSVEDLSILPLEESSTIG